MPDECRNRADFIALNGEVLQPRSPLSRYLQRGGGPECREGSRLEGCQCRLSLRSEACLMPCPDRSLS